MNKAQLKRYIGNPRVAAVQTESGYIPREGPNWDVLLDWHISGKETVGTYVLDGDKARFIVFDVDSDGSETGMEYALKDAERVVDALRELGVRQPHIGTEFSGRKGYHVWVLFQTYLPAHDLRRLGRAALALAGVECELFPKQDSAVKLGNLVKLPVGIHKGSGRRSTWITDPPVPMPTRMFETILEDLPEIEVSGGGGGESIPIQCYHHIQTEGASQGERNIHLFQAAILARRGGLTDPLALRAHLDDLNSRFDPPLSEKEVNDIMSSSADKGPLCDHLSDDVKCDNDHCVRTRHVGLYMREGQVRHAGEGENVVVQVKRAEGGKYKELAHPDIEQGKVILK